MNSERSNIGFRLLTGIGRVAEVKGRLNVDFVPETEIAKAESAAASVRGVRRVENQLMPGLAESPQVAS
jgi:osmotically-inducible protein OsmY